MKKTFYLIAMLLFFYSLAQKFLPSNPFNPSNLFKKKFISFLLIFFTTICFFESKGNITENKRPADTFSALDLKKTILYAVEKAPSFDSIKRELFIATLDEKSSYARFFPSLDLSTSFGLQNQIPQVQTGTGPWVSNFSLQLVETLYDNGLSLTNYDIAKMKRKQTELYFEIQKNKLSLNIASEYLKFSLYVKLLEIQQEQFQLLKKQYQRISSDYHQGLKTRKDFLRFKTQISRGEIDLIYSKSLVENSKQELKKLIGMNEDSMIEFTPLDLSKTIEKLGSEQWTEIKIEKHFEYEVSNFQKKMNDLESLLVKRKNWPEVSFSAGASYQNLQYSDKAVPFSSGKSDSSSENINWNALLVFKYNLWDWGIRGRDQEIAEHRRKIQNNEQEIKILSLKTQIHQLILQLIELKEQYKLSKELLSLEQANMSFIEREYRNGKVHYYDLITGLKDLADAQIKYYTSISSLQTNDYLYKYHQGTLYDFITK